MTLPVSMEDMELFAKSTSLNTTLPSGGIALDEECFDDMFKSQTKLWWSRLIISVRGYVVNYYNSKGQEDTVFLLDDAFIELHRAIAEGDKDSAHRMLADLAAICAVPEITQKMEQLSSGVALSTEDDPFTSSRSGETFERLFGKDPDLNTFYAASRQLISYLAFGRAFAILQERWKANKSKKKGIRFEEDPEWQPDDRVVLFEQFFQGSRDHQRTLLGNRTWVLTDFDRHVLNCWRPHGVPVIFGDRYTQTKLGEGFKLCSYCGMIEQQVNQFPLCPHCEQVSYCSQECMQNDTQDHEEKCVQKKQTSTEISNDHSADNSEQNNIEVT